MEDSSPNLEGYEVIRKIGAGGMSVVNLSCKSSIAR